MNSVNYRGQNVPEKVILLNKKDGKNNENKNNTTYQCSLCKLDHNKMMLDSNYLSTATAVVNSLPSSPDSESRLYTISENIFGIFCSATKSQHKLQQETIFNALLKIKECFKNSNIKLYCLTEICPDALKLCDTTVNFYVNLSKPPKLKSILIFCDNLFDWLAKANENRVLICCQGSASIIMLMVYAYSCYYDALPRRDMRLSMALKIFITSNNKLLEKVPISYRRYGGYMSLYSCMNQLQSLRSSVYLYCLVLHSFPSMESDTDKASQLFFKFYTNDPLVCIHTTKLYSLTASVNRLVILFDQYHISLHNDSMVVCYHRCLSGNRRIKLFRLNFHTCQAISDMLTFHCQDFEDVYPACPIKMKIDLYFRETAVFGQGENDYFVETSHSDLSSIERSDSYTFLENDENYLNTGSSIIINNKMEDSKNSTEAKVLQDKCIKDTTSISVYKTSVEDHRETINEKTTEKGDSKIISQSGQISGPIDSYHSTKLDTVHTSSSILNGSGVINNDFNTVSHNYGNRNCQNQTFTSTDQDKCSQQLDTLMKDLNLENTSSSYRSKIDSINYMPHKENLNENNTQNTSNKTNNREIQLMNELLEAQREISNLRRSMNHLDVTDQSVSPKYKGMTKGSVNSSVPDAYHCSKSRSNNRSDNHINSNSCLSPNKRTIPNLNTTHSFSVETSCINEFQGHQTGYSAHRENIEQNRMMKKKYLTSEKMTHQNLHDQKESTDMFEEVETINLQPIGKGIQDLTKESPQYKIPMGASKGASATHLFNDNIGSFSPLSTRKYLVQNKIETNSINSPLMSYNISFHGNQQNITLQSVEDKIQNWYQPQITRDEAIAILKNCNPGNFLIRDSNTYSGAYGIAIKVATIPKNITVKSDDLESEKVRHYLIELVGNQSLCFKGFPEEPVFPSLSHLVLYYTQTASVLPCLLVLPDKRLVQYDMVKPTRNNISSKSIIMSSPKLPINRKPDETGYSVYYLGDYNVEYITGPSVINRAVERLLEYLDARKFTECQMRINSGDGIVLIDLERKLFLRRRHPFFSITYCAMDPKDRKIELEVCKSKGIKKTKIFGIIVNAHSTGENKCFLFGELDPVHKADVIVKIINEQMQKTAEN